jgi:sugar/nucleoside kinase (ribokinase family)
VDWEALLADILPMCDVISPSADDMRSALNAPELGAVEAAEWLIQRGAAIAMVSDGPRELVVRTAKPERFAGGPGAHPTLLARMPDSWHDRRVALSPLKGPIVQTTGAGDAATAALLAGIHWHLECDDALALVLAASAHRVAGKGALSGLAPS